MVSITLSIEEELKKKMEHFSWVNWSELAREKALKKEIFEEFIKTGTLSEESQKFCDEIDWYPIDELEIKEEYIEKLKKIERGPHTKINLEQLDKLIGLK